MKMIINQLDEDDDDDDSEYGDDDDVCRSQANRIIMMTRIHLHVRIGNMQAWAYPKNCHKSVTQDDDLIQEENSNM